mmetsp:Transcript_12000/g.27766  ORF Transcript_12000/g.27766 Transcript_12000/m.27766 type:complete len:237 (-) Transcript_12000:303-1013(-)
MWRVHRPRARNDQDAGTGSWSTLWMDLPPTNDSEIQPRRFQEDSDGVSVSSISSWHVTWRQVRPSPLDRFRTRTDPVHPMPRNTCYDCPPRHPEGYCRQIAIVGFPHSRYSDCVIDSIHAIADSGKRFVRLRPCLSGKFPCKPNRFFPSCLLVRGGVHRERRLPHLPFHDCQWQFLSMHWLARQVIYQISKWQTVEPHDQKHSMLLNAYYGLRKRGGGQSKKKMSPQCVVCLLGSP